MFVVALVFPMMVYLAARVIPPRLFGRSLAAAAIVFLAYGQGFFVHSDFFGLIGPFRETAGERATVESISSSESEQYRTLYVPNAESYYYHPGVFDYHFESGDEPQIRFLPGITMGAGSKWTPYEGTQDILKALDELVPDGADPRTQTMLLQLAGVRRIVVHDIGVPGSGVRIGSRRRSALSRTGAKANLEMRASSARSDDRSLWTFDLPGAAGRTRRGLRVWRAAARRSVRRACAGSGRGEMRIGPATVVSGSRRSFRTDPAVGELSVSSGRRASRSGRPRANVKIESTDGSNGILRGHSWRGFKTSRCSSSRPFRAARPGIFVSNVFQRVAPRFGCSSMRPMTRNYYQTTWTSAACVQDVAVNFREHFGSIGQPTPERKSIPAVRVEKPAAAR